MLLSNHQNLRRSSLLFASTGVFVIVLGAIGAVGWFLNIGAFKSVFPSYATMKFNTALCVIISGFSFIMLIRYDDLFLKSLFRILLISFGVFSFISLSQDIFHYSIGIDQLFATDYNSIARGLPFPGRMSPSTALSFSLLAISFAGIDSKSRTYKNIAQYLLHAITLIAFVSLIGYLFKVPYSRKFSFFSTMALNTGIVFLLLSTVASIINYSLGFTRFFTGTGIGNIMARRLFPGMVASLIIVGYISIELQRNDYITPEFGVVLSTVTFLLIGLFLILGTLTAMNRIDLKRTEAVNESQQLNKNLEETVLQRTRELNHSNEKFIKIFNANPTCIVITRLDTGEYEDANPALVEMLGYTREELIGHTSLELSVISPAYRQYMVDSMHNKGFMRNEDGVFKDKNNNDRHCIVSAELFEDGDQKYMMSFIYDITDRKIIENNLHDTKRSLEVLTDKLSNQNKQLLSFAHIISHNLRAPVSNLNLLVHFYKESTTQDDKDELWGNFETVIGHLNTTLDELLETLKIQEDIAKEREALSFEKTFNGVKEILIGQIKESKAVITADFSKAAEIVYPKIYLESIMLNLISNALKYKSPERVPEITITSDNVAGEAILTVKDNGLGIDMARHSENLFGLRKTFHRHTEAKGVGLFLTKTQVETMGGEISAESVVDEGSVFKVVFNKAQL